MSAEIASIDRVRDAIVALRAKGVRPTADRVINAIGGGSKSRVLEHMRTLREDPPFADELPATLVDLMKPAMLEIFKAGRAAEGEKARVATERLSLVVGEQDEQILELAVENERLQERVAELLAALEGADIDQSANAGRIADMQAEIDRLRSQLIEERRSMDAGMQEALARMEAILAAADNKTRHGNIQRKGTLTLPGRPNSTDIS